MKKFRCPRCQNDVAEEIVVDAVIFNEVKGFDENGELDYGTCGEVQGGYIDGYQCKSCGYVIPNVRGPEEMMNWIEENGTEDKDNNC